MTLFNDLKVKKILLIILGALVLIILAFIIFSLINSKTSVPSPGVSQDGDGPIIIPLEYLSSAELNELGVDPSIKAQIISRDPLIYKIINSEDDIVKDIRPLLEPFRE